ncbi:DUF6083 domain-containing protein [Streptomyces sp. NBC_01565]|uniref:DUF6083 domain-containing protein n=1 Tax=Streptomyces sp. NBC_01565 TaxID=2975881 RepID=UPI002255C0B4|nr:DUF6083 domain-containing protein [Streptomyces sp. NBC_01565]MCX4546454.1 DUF6083 domain-containing protein [Streptomyces sp. NBC_01565]
MYSQDVAPWDRDGAPARTLWIDAFSPAKGLRGNNVDRCRCCHHLVECYDRDDGGRISLVPHEFPTASIRLRCRWNVSGGVASPGDQGRTHCYIAHPTLCPGIEPEDADDPQLAGARRALAVRTQQAISQGLFTAPGRVTRHEVTLSPAPAPAPAPAARPASTRHILTYSGRLWIGPAEIDRIRCVAHASTTGQRYRRTVLNREDPYWGAWEQAAVPVPPGRAAQESLWAGRTMWVFSINGLDYHGYRRWLAQRCTAHWQGTAHDAIAPQWDRFSVFRDEAHITYERPPHAQRAQPTPQTPRLVRCAGDGCTHTTVRTVEEGWLCWQCERRHKRRRRTHQRWTWAEEEETQHGRDARPPEEASPSRN